MEFTSVTLFSQLYGIAVAFLDQVRAYVDPFLVDPWPGIQFIKDAVDWTVIPWLFPGIPEFLQECIDAGMSAGGFLLILAFSGFLVVRFVRFLVDLFTF